MPNYESTAVFRADISSLKKEMQAVAAVSIVVLGHRDQMHPKIMLQLILLTKVVGPVILPISKNKPKKRNRSLKINIKTKQKTTPKAIEKLTKKEKSGQNPTKKENKYFRRTAK